MKNEKYFLSSIHDYLILQNSRAIDYTDISINSLKTYMNQSKIRNYKTNKYKGTLPPKRHCSYIFPFRC